MTAGSVNEVGKTTTKLAVAVERDVTAKRTADTRHITDHTPTATTAPEVVATPA